MKFHLVVRSRCLFDAFPFKQKYIAEKVGSDEKLSWVKRHMEKGFTGRYGILIIIINCCFI